MPRPDRWRRRVSGARDTDSVGSLSAADLLQVRAALAAGAAPAEALRTSTAPALSQVRAALRAGRGLGALAGEDALTLTGAGGPLVRSLAVAEAAGAPPGAAVDGVIGGVRATGRLQRLVTVRAAQAVMSARLLVGLPVIGAALLAVSDPGARAVMASPIGLVAMALAAVLIAIATWWIRRLLGGVAGAASTEDPLTADPARGPSPTVIAAAVTGVVAMILAGPLVGLLAAGMLHLFGRWAVPRLAEEAPADQIVPRTPGSLPGVEALELAALALAAGVGLAEACRLAAVSGPVEARPVMARIAARLAAGATPREAFGDRLAEVADLIDISHRWGAPTAEPLRLLAGDLRDRAAAAAEAAAERLAVRLVFPTTLLLVPAFGLLVVVPFAGAIIADIDLGL